MIRASELRLGNWYNNGVDNYTLGTSAFMDYLNEAQVNEGIIDNIYPIPISPDILEKCGFKERTWGKPDGWDKYGKSYAIGRYDTNYVLHRSWENEPDWRMGIECTDATDEINYMSESFCWQIKYLHQLQNLYYALTQTELKINL